MMLFHVPSNVSAYIKCAYKHYCDQNEKMGAFCAWYSCPVCEYRVCGSCAPHVGAQAQNPNKRTVENLLAYQFKKVGTDMKDKEKAQEAGGSPSAVDIQ